MAPLMDSQQKGGSKAAFTKNKQQLCNTKRFVFTNFLQKTKQKSKNSKQPNNQLSGDQQNAISITWGLPLCCRLVWSCLMSMLWFMGRRPMLRRMNPCAFMVSHSDHMAADT